MKKPKRNPITEILVAALAATASADLTGIIPEDFDMWGYVVDIDLTPFIFLALGISFVAYIIYR